ncbi:MAG TPA: serine protease [Vicinamibacterales bacterium]
MALSAQQRTEFIDLLVSNVPSNAFIEVVREQGVVADYDLLRKQAPDELTAARRFIASQVVDTYDGKNRISQLAAGLYRRVYLDDYLAPKLAAYTVESDAAVDDAAKQAAIVRRANTMSSRLLREFLCENEPRICLIMAGNKAAAADPPLRLGTGFLVGPDTVLTAYHTLKDHIAAGKRVDPSPGRCCAVFDYYDGDPLIDFDSIPPSCRVVEFDKDWLLASKEDMPKDGLFRDPDQDQLKLLPTRLDFALIKLADAVGKQTRERAGGARRSWVRVSVPQVQLRNEDRIIIPQHPNGYHQRIDFGRFSEQDSAFDTSKTRFRYDTETDQGTSGAPCFDHRFALVGMHNASFRPANVDLRKNQAIRIEPIHDVIATVPDRADADAAPVRLWNTSTSNEPRVILGRTILLDWLERGQTETTSDAKQRVYAATIKPDDRANSTGFGKRFTIEILAAARRGRAEPIVLLGTGRDSLPDSVPDLVRAIGFQLGIDKARLDTMPPRPSADLPSEAPNADKLRRWASQDVPAWFDDVIAKWGQEEIDEVAEAKKRITLAQQNNLQPNPQDVELAREVGPKMTVRRRWPIAWIAINLAGAAISEEVQDVLAGLIVRPSESMMPKQLRRLRWVFIGEAPDFLSTDQYTVDELDPRLITTQDIIAATKLLADSMAFDLTSTDLEFAEGMLQLVTGHPSAVDPNQRLAYFQGTVFPKIRELLTRLGKP